MFRIPCRRRLLTAQIENMADTRILALTLVAAGIGCSWAQVTNGAGTITAAASTAGFGIDRGVARLYCAQPELGPRNYRRSRGIVIDTGDAEPDREVLLVSRHGLPDAVEHIRERCTINGVRGGPIRIAAWFLPDRTSAATGDDWAVIVTEGTIDAEVTRHRYALVDDAGLQALIESEAAARLLLYSEAVDETGCRMRKTTSESVGVGSNLFVHSCRSWPGTSGSPIVIRINEVNTLIGMNIGRIWSPGPDDSGMYAGLGVAINGEIAAAIERAARFAASPLATSHSPDNRGTHRVPRERRR